MDIADKRGRSVGYGSLDRQATEKTAALITGQSKSPRSVHIVGLIEIVPWHLMIGNTFGPFFIFKLFSKSLHILIIII